jgi:Lamin Tail Domain/Bacterial TSP3 repeat
MGWILLAWLSRALAVDTAVVFTEIHYQPSGAGGDSVEWLELHNPMAVDVELSGWRLSEGVGFTFPAGTILAGGGYLVVAAEATALVSATGATNVLGPFSGRLDNSGERLELRNHNGRLMESIRYGTDFPWPVIPAGSGATLSRHDEFLPTSDPAAWTHSRRMGGTPSAANVPAGPPVPPPVRLSEIAGTGDRPFWLEIFNPTDQPLSLDGLAVRRVGGGGNEWVPPAGVILPGRGYLAWDQNTLGWIPKSGDRLLLVNRMEGEYLDGVTMGRAALARRGSDNRWWTPSRLTPGTVNEFPPQGEVVINEIQYHVPDLPAQPAEVTERPLLAVDSVWRYDQSGSEPAGDWRQPGFSDSGWRQGAGAFFAEDADLPAPKSTPLTLGRITYYFRTTVVVEEKSAATQLALRLLVDDGAVVSLNGTEILRMNLPEGPLEYTTFAAPSVGNAVFSDRKVVPSESLRVGTNVLAVEVHQSSLGSSDVVFGLEASLIEEIRPALPLRESPESWVELHNPGTRAVELSGWRLEEGIDFTFPVNTQLEAGGYLVVAHDAASLREQRPGIRVLGNFAGRLSRSGDAVTLLDALGNPVDRVRYFTGKPWPSAPDGGGSSLELRDPRSDNAQAGAWAASDESGRSVWKSYRYEGVAQSDGGPTQWNEFVLGLLAAGEVLIDDLSVIESPDTASARELLVNGDFSSGTASWRRLGNHRRSEVVPDPDQPGNSVLRLVATGPTEHMHNHLETTLVGGARVEDGRTYRIAFRARWISGSPRLNSRLYFSRLARTTVLELPELSGTPGARNSRWLTNAGPTFSGLRHFPVIPAPTDPVTVVVTPADPEGVAECLLWWNPGARGWQSAVMNRSGEASWQAEIPPQAAATVVQFYVEAADAAGARSVFPPAGRDSRVLYQVRDGQAANTRLHQMRIVMTVADSAFQFAATNLMSNEALGGTLYVDETEPLYDIGVRLHSSERGRPDSSRVGFTLEFDADRPFRGVHDSVTLDRSGGYSGRGGRQDEIVLRHIMTQAGGLPEMYTDLVRGIYPRNLDGRRTGVAQLVTTKYGDGFLEDSYPNGSDGSLFKLELIYYPTTSVGGNPQNPKLPQPDDVIGTDIQDRGDDPEAYRWYFPIENLRSGDDYAPVIRLAKAMSLGGAALDRESRDLMDVDQWARAMALKSLSGDADTYAVGYPHNQFIYFRPGDGKALTFPWDMDFCWARGPTESLPVGANIGRILELPGNRRLFYGHLQDLLNRSYNPTYLARWTSHFGTLAGQNYGGVLTYIRQRSAYARQQLPPAVPLSIRTGAGQDVLTGASAITLTGTAGIDLRTLVLRSPETAGEWTWSSITEWQIRVPLWLGTNRLEVLGYDFAGQLVASNAITVVSTAVGGGADLDADGLPDAWERVHGLDPLRADSLADADGDGFANRDEYLAGTDPQRAGSRLRIQADGAVDGVTLRFRTEAGRTYALQEADPIPGGVWTTVQTVPPEITVRDIETLQPAGATPRSRFYRVIIP